MDGKRSGRGRLGRSRGFALEAPVLEGTWEADALVDGTVELAGGEAFRGALREAPESDRIRSFPRQPEAFQGFAPGDCVNFLRNAS